MIGAAAARVGRPLVLLSMLTLLAACGRAPVAARHAHPTNSASAQLAAETPSPVATPIPTPTPALDQPTPDQSRPEPVQPGPPEGAPPKPAACSASPTGSLTIGFENYNTGLAGLSWSASSSCESVTVLLTSNYGMRYSAGCPAGYPCQGRYNDQPPPAASKTGVTYSLVVTDAAGHTWTLASVTSKPWGPIIGSPLPIFPSPHA